MSLNALPAVGVAVPANWLAPVGSLSDVGLVEDLRRWLRFVSQGQARCAELVGEAERRGLAAREGFGSNTD